MTPALPPLLLWRSQPVSGPVNVASYCHHGSLLSYDFQCCICTLLTLLDPMHLVGVAVPPGFLPSPSPPAPHPTPPGCCMGTRASICVNSDDTLVLGGHLVVRSSCELRIRSGWRSRSPTHQPSMGGRSRSPTCGVWRSAFGVQCLAFSVWRSVFGVQCLLCYEGVALHLACSPKVSASCTSSNCW